jgi:hypothetical protein
MWNSYVQAVEVAQRRTAVSSKCFNVFSYTIHAQTDFALALSIFFPLLLWRFPSSQLFCVHYTAWTVRKYDVWKTARVEKETLRIVWLDPYPARRSSRTTTACRLLINYIRNYSSYVEIISPGHKFSKRCAMWQGTKSTWQLLSTGEPSEWSPVSTPPTSGIWQRNLRICRGSSYVVNSGSGSTWHSSRLRHYD